MSARGLMPHDRPSTRRPLEVVGRPVFGYPGGVSLRSPLDTLKDLRQRVHEDEQTRLASHAEAERSAEAAQERARQVLLAATARYEAARRDEEQRLVQDGITAAEGWRRAVWESAERKAQALLWEEHERAVDSYRLAAADHERARESMSRADAELRQVRERIEKRERERQRSEEKAQQEMLDESSLRRFVERNGT